MPGEDHRNRVGPLQTAERLAGSVTRRHPLIEVEIDELRHALRIGFGRELTAHSQHLGLEFLVILDDAVVHDRHAIGCMRMGIGFIGQSMRRPACVTNGRHAGKRLHIENGLKIIQLSCRTATGNLPVDEAGDTG